MRRRRVATNPDGPFLLSPLPSSRIRPSLSASRRTDDAPGTTTTTRRVPHSRGSPRWEGPGCVRAARWIFSQKVGGLSYLMSANLGTGVGGLREIRASPSISTNPLYFLLHAQEYRHEVLRKIRRTSFYGPLSGFCRLGLRLFRPGAARGVGLELSILHQRKR